jgi:hypothetical protein
MVFENMTLKSFILLQSSLPGSGMKSMRVDRIWATKDCFLSFQNVNHYLKMSAHSKIALCSSRYCNLVLSSTYLHRIQLIVVPKVSFQIALKNNLQSDNQSKALNIAELS